MNKNKNQTPKKNYKITSKEDAPKWMLNNEHLSEGYRVNFKSRRNLAKTMCMKHNEITHIWTHLIGFLIFFILMIGLMSQRSTNRKIYKQLKDDFEKYHLEKFNEEFIYDIANFIKEMKQKAQNQYNTININQLSTKINNYIMHLKDFQKNIQFKDHKHIQNYNKYLNKIENQKIQEQIHQINSSNLNDKKFYFDEVNKIFQIQKEQIMNQLPSISELEYYPIIIYIMSALLCLGFSTVYHIFRPLSQRVNNILYRLDIGGISILVFGSSFACSYYIYYCKPKLQLFYAIVEFTTCFSVFIITYLERFNKKKYVPLKGMLFGALGLGNGLSLSHAWYLFKFHENCHIFDSIFIGTIIMGVLYLTGLFFFVKKIPESLIPKKFDIWLNSHTIFHIFVFIAAVQYYLTLEHLYKLRSINICK